MLVSMLLVRKSKQGRAKERQKGEMKRDQLAKGERENAKRAGVYLCYVLCSGENAQRPGRSQALALFSCVDY